MTDVPVVSPEALVEQRLRGDVYLDVRSVEEFSEGHIPGAFNVPWMLGTLAGLVPNEDFTRVVTGVWPPGTALTVGCRTGARARTACEALCAVGYVVQLDPDGICGANDAFGRPGRGWVSRGGELSARALPGRTYRELQAQASNARI